MSGPPGVAGPRGRRVQRMEWSMAEETYLRAHGADEKDDLARWSCSQAVNARAVGEIHKRVGAVTSDQRDEPHDALGPLFRSDFEVLGPHVVPVLRLARQMSLEADANALEKPPAATEPLPRRALVPPRRCLPSGAAR